MPDKPVIVIGAGMTGLIAALELQRAGREVLVLEKSDAIGGRMKTDLVNGFKLDRGFQVMLTAYPVYQDQETFDLPKLKLKHFTPGAAIIKSKGGFWRIADGFRKPNYFWETLLSTAGSAGDKIKILRLTAELRHISPADTFRDYQGETHEFLKDYGFTDNFIRRFFKPFYAGIFLEPELKTSAAMFAFVFKMFAEGTASLPADGIQSIPQQVAARLKPGTIQLNSGVKKLGDFQVELENGGIVQSSAIVDTSGPNSINNSFHEQHEIGWHDTHVVYFELDEPMKLGKFIVLDPRSFSPINHVVELTAVQPALAPSGKHLLSISLKPGLAWSESMKHSLLFELSGGLKQQVTGKYIAHYHVSRALPAQWKVKYKPEIIKPKPGLFISGDYLGNGSVNAAVFAGQKLAAAVLS